MIARDRAGRAVRLGLWAAACVLTALSAAWTKQTGALPALVGVERAPLLATPAPAASDLSDVPGVAVEPAAVEIVELDPASPEAQQILHPLGTRWFNGRRVRPARVVLMKVTGYSPDARSCGIYADGQTATLHSVWTNAMRLVAADPRVLPYRSMVSVPGYADGEIVPVLDCGAAIKGNKLDLLFPTHQRALRWGVKQIPVTIWEYADEG